MGKQIKDESQFLMLYYFQQGEIRELLQFLEKLNGGDATYLKVLSKLKDIVNNKKADEHFTRKEVNFCRKVLKKKMPELRNKLYFDYVPLTRFMEQCGAVLDEEKIAIKTKLQANKVSIYEEKQSSFTEIKSLQDSDSLDNLFLEQTFVDNLDFSNDENFNFFVSKEDGLKKIINLPLLDYTDAALFFLLGYTDGAKMTKLMLEKNKNLIADTIIERWHYKLPSATDLMLKHYVEVFRNLICQKKENANHLLSISEYITFLNEKRMYIHSKVKSLVADLNQAEGLTDRSSDSSATLGSTKNSDTNVVKSKAYKNLLKVLGLFASYLANNGASKNKDKFKTGSEINASAIADSLIGFQDPSGVSCSLRDRALRAKITGGLKLVIEEGINSLVKEE